jgi:hypothetical protein
VIDPHFAPVESHRSQAYAYVVGHPVHDPVVADRDLPRFVGPEIEGRAESRGGDRLVVGVVDVVVVHVVVVVGVVEVVVVVGVVEVEVEVVVVVGVVVLVVVVVVVAVALVDVAVVVVGTEEGAAVRLKLVGLVAVPPGVVTVSRPLLAAAGTVAVICESESTVNDAAMPLNRTAVAPVKPDPAIVTVVPTEPFVGVSAQTQGVSCAWAVPPG